MNERIGFGLYQSYVRFIAKSLLPFAAPNNFCWDVYN